MSEIKFVYLNGELVPKSEARVSCFDEGVTHGWAVYEGIRVYDGKILERDRALTTIDGRGALLKAQERTDEIIERFFEDHPEQRRNWEKMAPYGK